MAHYARITYSLYINYPPNFFSKRNKLFNSSQLRANNEPVHYTESWKLYTFPELIELSNTEIDLL